MGCFTRPPLAVGAVLLSLMTLSFGCRDSFDTQQPRSLGNYEIHQVPEYPGGFPPAWAAEFHVAMQQAPPMSLGDDHAAALIRDHLLRLKWIDPQRLAVEPALPEGMRVYFQPLSPRLAVAHGDRPFALLAERNGAVLPDGIGEDTMHMFIRVSIDPGVELPPAGQISSDPLIQEAYRVWPEIAQIALDLELNVVAIQRKSTSLTNAKDMAPALSFYLDTGVEVSWGRARDTPDAFSTNALGEKLTMLQKATRLMAVLEEYPGLIGVGRVVLDMPIVRVFDPHEQPLPLQAQLR
jgi:hypothetical protein